MDFFSGDLSPAEPNDLQAHRTNLELALGLMLQPRRAVDLIDCVSVSFVLGQV